MTKELGILGIIHILCLFKEGGVGQAKYDNCIMVRGVGHQKYDG